ncbi:threonine/homoserine/homoserine lactone efflux protein [Kocuria palustris]|nr:threonine/homoserine/homoserine lactone efflux protein [Kocuria palustris]
MAFVVAAGIGPLIAAVPLALTAVTLVGAVYLIVLSIGVLRAPRPDVGSLASSVQQGRRWPRRTGDRSSVRAPR